MEYEGWLPWLHKLDIELYSNQQNSVNILTSYLPKTHFNTIRSWMPKPPKFRLSNTTCRIVALFMDTITV